MGKKYKKEDELKCNVVKFRVPMNEKELIQAQAEKKAMSVSEYLRWLVQNDENGGTSCK